MNNILYLIYGSGENVSEAVYSILSIYKLHPDDNIRIHIYTDREDLFPAWVKTGSRFVLHVKSAEDIQEWQQPIGLSHRAKIKAIEDFFRDNDGNVIYLDSDTYVLNNLFPLFQKISAGELVMHLNEGSLRQGKKDSKKDSIARKMETFFDNFQYNDSNSQVKKIPAESYMWNAGVIGMNKKHQHLLSDVIYLTDILFPSHPNHTIEQFSFSYIFQTQQPILPAASFILHYWKFKEYRTILDSFFQRYDKDSLNDLLGNMELINPAVLVEPKMKYINLPGWRRAIKKITGTRWKLYNPLEVQKKD